MKISISYGKRFEIIRIISTLKKIDWYKKHRYRPFLPKNVTIKNTEKKVEKDYQEKDYQKAAKDIENEFPKIEKEFLKKLKKETKKSPPKEVKIVLTKYGVGGSYNPPDRVILNIKYNNTKKYLIKVLKHEIIHLVMEDEVRKKKLSQEEKEELIRSIEKLV